MISACNTWAVGRQASGGDEQTLTEHWNGSAWKVVPSPDPGTSSNELNSVRGRSASDVWAVGDSADLAKTRTLILHWDGHTWARVASPNPRRRQGRRRAERRDRPRCEHRLGGGLQQPQDLDPALERSQLGGGAQSNLGSDLTFLAAVAAGSPSNAWAVGTFEDTGGPSQALALHCC